MRQVALIFWFFFITVCTIFFFNYRTWFGDWFHKIQEEQKAKGDSLWNHPTLKWPIRIFLIFTAVAWLDIVVWGISSVIPLALFLAIIGGRKALEENAHILLMLASFWAICYLLFNQSPAEFIAHFKLETLCTVYGVSSEIIQPFIIPLVALFFLGIASLIFQTRIIWGIGAILVSTCFPFILGFFFGGRPEGVGAKSLAFLGRFYETDLVAMKIVLLPQALLLAAGILLLVKKRVFGGVVWIGLALMAPWFIAPAKALYASISSPSVSPSSIFRSLAEFYAMPSDVLKIMVLLQIAFIFSALVVGYQKKKAFTAILLFFLGLLLPWILVWSREGIQKFLIPFWQELPRSVQDMARLYNRPEDVIRNFLMPMALCVVLGMGLLFTQKGKGIGILLCLFGFAMPWLSEPLGFLYSQLCKLRLEGLTPYYKAPTEQLQTLIIPMVALFAFGLIAMFQERKFWGAMLILVAIFLPWIIVPIEKCVFNLQTYPDYNFGLVCGYYNVSSTQLGYYLPAMILLALAGILKATVQNRPGDGLLLAGIAIYLPFWWPLLCDYISLIASRR